jgi:hypothetical protein
MMPVQEWIDDPDEPEIALEGGDVTEDLVRRGATIRRPYGDHSRLVRQLLRHLESVGFNGAPRFLGVDSAGREVLTFIEGEVAGRPRPKWIADEDRLVSVARLVRAYDDAAAGFGLPDNLLPAPAQPAGLPPGPSASPELIGHQDVTPENVVFRDGEAFALIDFDLARPATRVMEVLNVMLWWGPFGADEDLDPLMRGLDIPRRCGLIADAYGLSAKDRGQLVEVAILQNRRAWHLMKHRAETMGGGWRRMWDEGVGDIIHRRQTWLEHNTTVINKALQSPTR